MPDNKKSGRVLQYSPTNNTSSTARVPIIPNSDYQELEDFSSSGRKRPWTQKKSNSILIGDSFSRISQIYPDLDEYYQKKANRIYDCGSYLLFQRFTDNSLKLKQAYFCRQRLCPMCNWRRSMKIFSQVSKIMDSMQSTKKYDYLFLTLTIKNVDAPELSTSIDELLKGYFKLINRTRVKKAILGCFKALEITYNSVDETYHPHLHIVIAVEKNYFNDSWKYISQDDWSKIWQDCMNLDYKPIVHIEKIKGDKKKAVAEASKYATKEEDVYMINEKKEKQANDEVVYTIDNALKGRRLISFSGVFKDYQKKLNLEDVENSDLIHVDEEAIRSDLNYVLETYHWRCGAYIMENVNRNIS